MIEIIKRAKRLLSEGKVKKIGEWGSMGQLYEVGTHSCRIYQKPGRTLMSCDCQNFTQFCNQPTMCCHVLACMLYESNEGFFEKVESFIGDYNDSRNLGIKPEPETIIEDLKSLKYLK